MPGLINAGNAPVQCAAGNMQGYRIWISFRRSRDHLGIRPHPPGSIVTRISSRRGRGRPVTVKCCAPVPPPSPGGNRKRTAFPPPLRNGAAKTLSPSVTQASARPGGREAPAGGGAGAGRGLWPPAARGVTETLWQRRWPLPLGRGARGKRKAPPTAAQGYRIWISFRRLRDHLVNRPQASGDIVTRISSERCRRRPVTVKCESLGPHAPGIGPTRQVTRDDGTRLKT